MRSFIATSFAATTTPASAPWTLPTLVGRLLNAAPVRTLCCFPGGPPMNPRFLAWLLVLLLTLRVVGWISTHVQSSVAP